MPSNFRKSTKPPKKKKSHQKNNQKNQKNNRPPHGGGVTWKSREPPKKEETYTQKNFYFIVAGIVVLFLFCLWAFVPDRAQIERAKAERAARQAQANRSQSQEYQVKEFKFNHAHLYNTSQFSETMKNYQENEDDERIILVAFDDSTREAEGLPTKVRLFRRYESIAKSLPRKKIFKRYEEEELPMIIAFDCGNPEDKQAEALCKQIIGENIPNVVVFRPRQQPRALPNEYRSDNQIITYLYNLMQPAVRYLEEINDCEDFVADDTQMNVVLFGNEPTGSFDQVADLLREFARFGKTRNEAVIEEFDVEENSIMIWKTFGQNPNRFVGNISDSQAVYSYIMNNYLPVFGEFTPTTSNRYMKRGLPIVWIAYDRYNDDSKDILDTGETMAHRYIGAMSFVQLDVKAYPQIASNFGIDVTADKNKDGDEEDDDDDDDEDDENAKGTDDDDDEDTNRLPQVFIMNQMAQLREFIETDNAEDAIEKVCDEYLRMARAARGEGLTELDGEIEDYDDDELEEDDDEDEMDNVELGEDYDEDEEDDEEEDDDDEDDIKPPGGEASEGATGSDGQKQDL